MGNPDADEYVTLFQLQYRLNDGSNSYATYQEPYGTPMVGLQNTLASFTVGFVFFHGALCPQKP